MKNGRRLKDKINAVIRAASEGSKFQKHQEVREKRIQLRIESQKKLLASLKESQLAEAKDQVCLTYRLISQQINLTIS